MLGGLAVVPGRAEITFSLAIIRESKPAYETNYGPTRFRALPWLNDTNEPLSYHRVEAPGAVCGANFGTNSGSGGIVFNSAVQLFQALTNGVWKLWLNRETEEEVEYEFTLSTETLAPESLGPVMINVPRNGGINVASNTPYLWTGPADFDEIEVLVRDATNETLTVTATAWTNGPVLVPGTNFFSVVYLRDVAGEFGVSTPTNELLGALTNWGVNFILLRSAAESGFISAGLPPSPLAEALDAPGMIWETGGDAAWFAQTTNTTDGVDAAQSGAIPDNALTTLRTVIYGTNSIRFRWRTEAEVFADYVAFTDNGNYVADLTGATVWQEFTYHLTDGQAHVLEWTYHKDGSEATGADAAFLDQVRLGAEVLPVAPPVELHLTIGREQRAAHEEISPNQLWFYARPSLSTTNPPWSYHEVSSPGGAFKATVGPTNTSVTVLPYDNFDALLNELTNGNWAIRLNRETPQEQFYAFKLGIVSLLSNDLGGVNITMPTNDAVEVLPYTTFAWADGLAEADELFVRTFQIRSNDTVFVYASEILTPATLTSWNGLPPLAAGTNYFEVRYTKSATTNFAVVPPFIGWSLEAVGYESRATASFIVASAQPVELAEPQIVGGDFQFQFLSQFGFTNLVQSCTNLAEGNWIIRTNIPGDGTLQTVLLPVGSEPMEFFRVITE